MPICIYHAPFALQTTGTTDAHMHIPCSICIPRKRGLRMPICIYHAAFVFEKNGDYGCPYAYTMLHSYFKKMGITDAHMHLPCCIRISKKKQKIKKIKYKQSQNGELWRGDNVTNDKNKLSSVPSCDSATAQSSFPASIPSHLNVEERVASLIALHAQPCLQYACRIQV